MLVWILTRTRCQLCELIPQTHLAHSVVHSQALRDGVDLCGFRPTYIDFGHMVPYADMIALYNPANVSNGSRISASEFFETGHCTPDGSQTGSTFVYRCRGPAASSRLRETFRFNRRGMQLNELTLLEAFVEDRIPPKAKDASFYLKHYVGHLSQYISATHHTKQSMPHYLAQTAGGLSQTLSDTKRRPIAALRSAIERHHPDTPRTAQIFERQEVSRCRILHQ
jgi:hypothetical protein